MLKYQRVNIKDALPLVFDATSTEEESSWYQSLGKFKGKLYLGETREHLSSLFLLSLLLIFLGSGTKASVS